jgi:[NiFe] hydrogenase diaphorase moiety small subunit
MPNTHSLQIDGQEIPFVPGQTVLQAALAAGLDIPHLCYRPELESIGSCRLCLVEVAGRRLSSCTLPAGDGQNIASAALRPLRARLVAMLLEQGQHVCLRCEKTGDCRLQDNAAALGAPAITPARRDFPARDDSHPEVLLDYSRCILCGICVQASRELDGKNLFAFGGVGGQARLLVNSASGLLHDSGIAAEDRAVRFCPTGALMAKPKEEVGFGFYGFDFFDGSG